MQGARVCGGVRCGTLPPGPGKGACKAVARGDARGPQGGFPPPPSPPASPSGNRWGRGWPLAVGGDAGRCRRDGCPDASRMRWPFAVAGSGRRRMGRGTSPPGTGCRMRCLSRIPSPSPLPSPLPGAGPMPPGMGGDKGGRQAPRMDGGGRQSGGRGTVGGIDGARTVGGGDADGLAARRRRRNPGPFRAGRWGSGRHVGGDVARMRPGIDGPGTFAAVPPARRPPPARRRCPDGLAARRRRSLSLPLALPDARCGAVAAGGMHGPARTPSAPHGRRGAARRGRGTSARSAAGMGSAGRERCRERPGIDGAGAGRWGTAGGNRWAGMRSAGTLAGRMGKRWPMGNGWPVCPGPDNPGESGRGIRA